MVRFKFLLIASIVTLVVAIAGPALAAARDGCTVIQINSGACDVNAETTGDQVTLTGTETTPGTAAVRPPRVTAGGKADDAALRPTKCARVVAGRCVGDIPRASDPVRATGAPAVTIRDLAAFRPAPPRQLMEPDGWVVPGLDANIFAIVGPQSIPGTLLARPATVRFTPVSYDWDYGDGSTAVRATAGGTWAQLGLRDFDPTPTSHVFAREGEYVIRLTVSFRAEYQFAGGGFQPVTGTIALAANELRVTVEGAKTVLVDRDCVSDPGGPGC